jgi:hypothetical protein
VQGRWALDFEDELRMNIAIFVFKWLCYIAFSMVYKLPILLVICSTWLSNIAHGLSNNTASMLYGPRKGWKSPITRLRFLFTSTHNIQELPSITLQLFKRLNGGIV